MKEYLSKKAQTLEPYLPGEQPKDKKHIKLNTNENPYPPSPRVLEAIRSYVNGDLRLYPDPDAAMLKEAIAKHEGLSPEQVFCANGSDEVLAFCFQAFFSKGRPVLFPDITYSFYPVFAALYGLDYKEIALGEKFEINISDYLIENTGIIFPNPNAPTGLCLPIDDIKRLIEYNLHKAAVIIDETYIGFGGLSVVELLGEYDNLIVTRTFSKTHSLAGLRVGYALGNKCLIEGLTRIKNSFNSYPVDRLACVGATVAIEDDAYYMDVRKKIIVTRQNTVNALRSLGFTMSESRANFILVFHPYIKAKKFCEYLYKNGVLVRYFDKPRIENGIRISIGTDKDMEIVVKLLKQYGP